MPRKKTNVAEATNKAITWAKTTEWDLLDKCLHAVERVYLYGPPGVGKSFAALHQDKDIPTFSVTLHDDLAVQELQGFMGWTINNGASAVEWIEGPIVRAMRLSALMPDTGSLLVINELHRAAPAMLDFMLSILDNNESCQITLPSNETVKPGPKFRVVATGNEPPDVLSEALASRFEAVIGVSRPHPNLVKALNAGIPGLGELVFNSYSGDPDKAIQPRCALAYIKMIKSGRFTEEQASVAAFGGQDPTGSVATDFLAGLRALTKSPVVEKK